MRPQGIVSNLSVNVIIHLEVKLNYEKILGNGYLSKEKKKGFFKPQKNESVKVFL